MTKEQRLQSIEEKMNTVYTNKKGLTCKIIKYRSFHDVDVIFEDGTIKENVGCDNLASGEFAHPKDMPDAKHRIGLTRSNKENILATVIQYNSANDFTIQFQDGTTKHLSTWRTFDNGDFSYEHQEHFKLSDGEIEKRKQITIINNSGYQMKLLNYRSTSDIDVIFDDGSIVTNKSYNEFIKGNISHPKYRTLKIEKLRLMQEHGIKDVLRYQNKNDFDVELEDGTIMYNVNYYRCTSGDLARLHHEKHLSQDEINERMKIIKRKNKHFAHIVEWRSCLDIDIAFEDGIRLNGITWNQFQNCNFTYPAEEIVKQSAEAYIYKNYKHNAKTRGLEFHLTKEEFLDLIHQPCYLCGRTDLNEIKNGQTGRVTYRYNGIDRIDNNIGYEIGNVAPCCRDCNRAKSTMSLQDFKTWVNLVKLNIG